MLNGVPGVPLTCVRLRPCAAHIGPGAADAPCEAEAWAWASAVTHWEKGVPFVPGAASARLWLSDTQYRP